MLMQKNKITMRQAFIIFIVSTYSPMIRLFPTLCSKFGKEGGWISPIISAVGLFLICMVLNTIFKNKAISNLSDAFNLSLGKIAGKILLSFYLFWCIILFFLYIRYYAERLLSSIFPSTDIRFFIIAILIIVYIGAHGKIEAFARFSEIAFLLFTGVIIMFFVLLIPNVKISNLLPITYLNIIPAAKATYPILGIWGYITLIFFLGEYIINKEQVKKISKQGIIYLTIISTLMLIFIVGSLGYTVAQRMPLPFFNATKLISFMETLDRFESILLSIWVIADFIVITLLAIIIMNITKNLFSLSESKFLASPVVLLGYIGSQYLSSNRFEMELFSSKFALETNIVVCFIIPIIVLGIGKLRKKI